MNCPHCGDQLVIRNQVLRNMEAYGRSVLAATECCGRPVRCTPTHSFTVVIADTQSNQDDWGVPFKKPKPPRSEKQIWLDDFIARAGFRYEWSELESWARRMAEQAYKDATGDGGG